MTGPVPQRHSLAIAWLLPLLTCATARAQSRPATQDPFVHLPVRVVSVGQGANAIILIDRGERDLLRAGDIVQLLPRGGQIQRGTVARVLPRSAEVRLNQPGFLAKPGMAGEALVPRARRRSAGSPPIETDEPTTPQDAEPKPTDSTPDSDPDPPADADSDPDRPTRWRNRDDAWRPGMPLLGKSTALQPRDRPSRVTGRAWIGGDYVDVEGDTDNSYWRAGTSLDWENPFGNGGAVHFDGEALGRNELDATDGISTSNGTDILIRRTSYSWGNDRFNATGVEIGRFLQRGMPEFGWLDGAEWTQRTSDGDRFGLALGYLPEPDDDFESFEDIQFAGHYQWAFDPGERTTLAVGFQQTIRDGDLDRDLLVTRLRHIPDEPTDWDLHASFWVDFYLGDDNGKSVNLELTQAFVATGRNFADGSRLDIAWRRVAFPDINRTGEFLPPTPLQLRDDVYDRVTVDWSASRTQAVRPHARLLGYLDEDAAGGGTDLGLDFASVLTEGDHLDVVGIFQHGEFNTLAGARTVYSLPDSGAGRFDLLYEYTFSRHRGFADDRDDLVTHRVQLSDNFRIGTAWDISLQAGLVSFDNVMAFNGGFFVQHSF